ncbi:MAG: UPF0158 family protein [Nocardioides sp.]
MAQKWLSITVELLGGRGKALWPMPGRVFAVGPSHTFAELGEAIDLAFARWDLAHLRRFDLADGIVVTDAETAADLADPAFGDAVPSLDVDAAKVARTVRPGDELRYVFDFGDGWTHRLSVDTETIDPQETVGLIPRLPTAYWGGGVIPDQYGRRWVHDDGEGDPPPAYDDPMLRGDWPARVAPAVDLTELRGAVARRDGDAIVAAVQGQDLDDLLQLAGAGAEVLLAIDHPGARALAESVVAGLSLRDGVGDDVLREDLLAQSNGTPIAARSVVVDLGELAYALNDHGNEWRSYLDLRTGDVVPGFLTDEGEVGDDFVDIDDDPDRYLAIEPGSSREGWQDMSAFVARLPAGELRERLDRAIEGRGAFRRFKDEAARAGLLDRWFAFSDDHERGRAREFLADHGIRVALA